MSDVRLVITHPRHGRLEYVGLDRGPNPRVALRGGGEARRSDIIQHAMQRGWGTRLVPVKEAE